MGVNVGNVTVRFSVQDQEAVRKVLSKPLALLWRMRH